MTSIREAPNSKRGALFNPQNDPAPTAIKNSVQIYTGTIAQILQVAKGGSTSMNTLYEIYASVLSITPGRFPCERIILLRGADMTGPVIQGFFYEVDLSLNPSCEKYQLVRCMGRFTSENRFNVIKIGPTTQAFVESVNRLNSFSSFSIFRT